ncbi:MAG TPA: trigger factor [Candidatus Paceibacterota bacterium]|nr:trigger factor [Candidatus Paceibacterota bacterium]
MATVTRDEKNWELVVKGEIPAAHIADHRAHVIAELKRDAHIQGFRPGKAPEDVVIKNVGDAEILRRTIEHAVQHELPEILAKENANIVTAPRVTVEKAPQSFPASEPIVFTARAPMAPEVKLPAYKAIAKKHNEKKEEISVTDEEHQQTLSHLKRERARITKIELGLTPQEAHTEAQKMEEKDLPALDDAFVKTLGYESLEKFSDSVRANIKTEKELQATEKRRAAMLDELIEKAVVRYPAILREYELDDMEARLKQDLDALRMPFDKYLAEVKKTREELRRSWEPAADKRAKMRLILAHIAIAEKLDADPERLEREVKHAKQHYPAADESNLRAHIVHALRNEAVIAFLEQQ